MIPYQANHLRQEKLFSKSEREGERESLPDLRAGSYSSYTSLCLFRVWGRIRKEILQCIPARIC